MVAMGLALFCPAISGAEPWLGSYSPSLVAPGLRWPACRWSRLSCWLCQTEYRRTCSVRITSNCAGFFTICMAQLSTSMSVSSHQDTPATPYNLPPQPGGVEHVRLIHAADLPFLLRAISNAVLAILAISFSLYIRVSIACPEAVHFLGPPVAKIQPPVSSLLQQNQSRHLLYLPLKGMPPSSSNNTAGLYWHKAQALFSASPASA